MKLEIELTPDGRYAVKEVYESGSTLLAICDDEVEANRIYNIFYQRGKYDNGETTKSS